MKKYSINWTGLPYLPKELAITIVDIFCQVICRAHEWYTDRFKKKTVAKEIELDEYERMFL